MLNLKRYFDFDTIANKRCHITLLSTKFDFPAHNSKQHSNFLAFFWQWDQSQNTFQDSATFITLSLLHQTTRHSAHCIGSTPSHGCIAVHFTVQWTIARKNVGFFELNYILGNERKNLKDEKVEKKHNSNVH